MPSIKIGMKHALIIINLQVNGRHSDYLWRLALSIAIDRDV